MILKLQNGNRKNPCRKYCDRLYSTTIGLFKFILSIYRKTSDVEPWRNSKMENFGGLLLGYFKDSKSENFSGCTIVGFLQSKKIESLASKTIDLQNAMAQHPRVYGKLIILLYYFNLVMLTGFNWF
jgi:hypothetical protein